MISMRNTKNVIEIIDKGIGDLIRCGSTAIRVLKVGYGIFPIPLDNGLMKKVVFLSPSVAQFFLALCRWYSSFLVRSSMCWVASCF